ncbi:MAG TPA: energy transducer TonB [Bacteroidia bacterium]|nr:energy transducer TonB [Bacteroidia bacterium]HNU32745.1 energy transducer TonB [Bacteroidia bacterium]
MKYLILMGCCFALTNCIAQNNAKTDSVIRSILGAENVTRLTGEGTELIKQNDFSGASLFFSNEIKKDDGNREAYFNRGIVNIVLADTMAACRDWSAVLALGDTATFKLLDSHCQGSMFIADDTLPKIVYRKMFAIEKGKDAGYVSAKVVVQQMPEFTGGPDGVFKYLKTNMNYPALAKQKKVQGTVYVNFIIDKKGKVLFPYIVRGIDKDCDKEALRLIKNMPQWKPGKNNGKPVIVRHNLPVIFSVK